MAKGDTPKVKGNKSWTKFNLSIRDDIPLKPPWGSTKRSSFPDIRRQSMKRLSSQRAHETTAASSTSRDSGVSEPISDGQRSQQFGQDVRVEPLRSSFPALDFAKRSDDLETNMLSPNEARGETFMTRRLPQPNAPLNAGKAMKGKDKAAVSPARPSMNSPVVLDQVHTQSLPETTDSGSAPTQILVMPHSSDKGTERRPRTSQELPTDSDDLSRTTLSSHYEQVDDIADLVRLCRTVETTNYISARDMSIHLDLMANQGLGSDRLPLQRSLTPFLGIPTSYTEFLAEATSSVKDHAVLFRFYVSAWVFMCATESRLDGLRLHFVIREVLCKLSTVQRDTTSSKPARLAMLAKQTWFSDVSVNDVEPIVLEAPASSNRTHRSLLEDTDSKKSLMATDMSNLPRKDGKGQTYSPASFSRGGPGATTIASSSIARELALLSDNQQRHIYDHAKAYFGYTSEQLTGRITEVWSWLDPVGRLSRLTPEDGRVLSGIEAERFFVPGRVFDVLTIPRMPSITSRSLRNLFAGTPGYELLPHPERFMVVKANRGRCDVIPVYVPDTSTAIETQAKNAEHAEHPKLYDAACSSDETTTERARETTLVPVRMVRGEVLRDGSRLNPDDKREIGFSAKVKGVGSVIGEQNISRLQSYSTRISGAEGDGLVSDRMLQGGLEAEDDWVDLGSAEQRQSGAGTSAVTAVRAHEDAGDGSQRNILATLYGLTQTIVDLAAKLTKGGAV